MIVVGGKNSSNTTELFNGLKPITKSIFIEDINAFEAELDANGITLSKDMKIGLTAGASTMKSELEALKTLLSNKIKEL
jgi:4-hydroxy-3-methylbut-2-enyl diphosphate reductase IspH